MMSLFKSRALFALDKARFECFVKAIAVIAICNSMSAKLSADWPGIHGPTRNGHAGASCSLPDSVAGSPKLVWKVDAGQGYAGPSVVGDELVVFERVGETDRVRMLNAKTGVQLWKRDLPARYRGGIDSDKGPRCVPTILESSILVYSAAGDLSLLARADGSLLWTRKLRAEYEADDGYFGAGSTPLVLNDKAIVNVGGKSANVVCVSLANGKSVWTAASGEASYASPILLTPESRVGLKDAICIVPTRMKTFGLDPDTGKEFWNVSFGQRGPTVNAASPITLDNGDVYLTASYGIGSIQLRVDNLKASIVRNGDEISSQYASPVAIDGKIFGSDGREDGGQSVYKCVAQSDGKLIWEKTGMPICHSIVVGNKILVVGIDGQIFGLSQGGDDIKQLWSSKLPKGIFRALPAFSENRLFVRTSGGNADAWYCFEFQ